jgi:hypothetical protein
MEKLIKAHTDLHRRYGNENFSYCDEALKRGLHKDAAAYLRMLATELGFDRNNYDMRSNKGGIAVSGEITLHTETLYVQISQWAGHGDCLSFLIRGCDSRKDYSGHTNHSMHLRSHNVEALLRMCELARRKEPEE